MKQAKLVPAAVIGNRVYRRADNAAEAYRQAIWDRAYERESLRLGCAAYHGERWARFDTFERRIRCYTRLLKIFKRYFNEE